MNRPISSTLIAWIALAACTPSPETPWEPADAPPASETSSTDASVVEELSIGVETGPEEYMLGRVVSLAVGPDGTIYVSEAQPFRRSDGTEALVRAYDAEGEYLRAIGRVGQGPGEYEYPVPAVLPGGRPAIQDGQLRRVSVYSTGGEFQHGFAANTGWSFLEIDREGNFYLQARPGGHSVAGRVLWKYSIEGELLETFPLPPQPPIPGEPLDFTLGLEGDIRPLFFRELYAGREGRIWVHRYVQALKRDDIEPVPSRPDRPLLTWREPPTYDVFEPDRTFVGTVVLPADFEPHVFRGNRVWGVRTDEAGVNQVVRLRVVPGA